MKTKDIEKSPVYNMSMCSLENFHTVFLKWLGIVYPKETIGLFLNNINEDNIRFKDQERENGNIYDLCVLKDNGEKILIIENKIKSYPTEEQIEKYKDANKKVPLILLSLAPADNIKLPEECKLSYAELANRMHKKFDNKNFSTDEKYNEYLIQDYIKIIEYLAKSFPKNTSMQYDFYDNDVSDELKDVYIKYRTSELCNFINKTTDITTTVDFRDKQGIINIWCNFEDYDITFLIQIQHNEYRYCLVYGDESENELRESISTRLAKNNIWFTNCIEKYPKARNYQSKNFCGYKPNFIYRYQTLEKVFNKQKTSEITYQEIAEKVRKDISSLLEHKHEIVRIIVECL